MAFVILLLVLLSGCASVSRPRPIAPDRCWADQEQFEEQILRASASELHLAGGAQMKIERSEHSVAAEL